MEERGIPSLISPYRYHIRKGEGEEEKDGKPERA